MKESANLSLIESVIASTALSSSRTLIKITFSSPSGLLIADTNTSNGETIHICLLKHNIIGLKPAYCRIKELKSVLSFKECAKIIQTAEEYATKNNGWTNSRHTNYATTDIPVNTLLGEDNYIDELVNENILKEFATFYGLNIDFLHIHELFVVKYEFEIGKQSGLVPHVDGTPWSFVVALNDSKEYGGGGTHFINNNLTCRSQKAGSAVLFSGKNLHEGLAITSGVRYILTGFCEYVYESDPDERNSPHTSFLRDYDVKYDGHAALGGVHTGDIIKGIYDVNGTIHYITKDDDMHSVLNQIRNTSICTSTDSDCTRIQVTTAEEHKSVTSSANKMKLPEEQHIKSLTGGANKTKLPQCSILVERLISTDYYEEVENCEDIISQSDDVHDDILTAAKCGKDDDTDLLDLIHGVDQFFTVGQYWQFDE